MSVLPPPEVPDSVRRYLRGEGFGEVAGCERLSGGAVSAVIAITTTCGDELVLKTLDAAPKGMYRCEAESLALLLERGVRAARPVTYGADFLLLRAAGAVAVEPDWQQVALVVHRMHSEHADRFGFPVDTFAGTIPQKNTWTDDGWDFFAQHRLLCWLREPGCQAVLNARDRSGVERIAARLPNLIAPSQPSLLHGDLWRNNVTSTADGTPSLIDPSLYYGWPLADLAQLLVWGSVPGRFFDLYGELRPLPTDWSQQAAVLALRDYLGIIALGAHTAATLEQLRGTLARFA